MMRRKSNKPVVDPVCGMTVDPAVAVAKTSYNGHQLYFCAEGCKKAFDADPGKFDRRRRKGFWRRYLDRLNKTTGGRPPSCCG